MDFFVPREKKTCSLCIDTFGANIVVIVNFIVAVSVITEPICQRPVHPGDSLDQAVGSQWRSGSGGRC